jgi:ribonuclease Z
MMTSARVNEAEERMNPSTKILAGIRFSGVSVAGRETYFFFPTLGLSFDLGRCPQVLIPSHHIFLTHAHLDHAAGVPYWMSQRRLLRMPDGKIWTEPTAVPVWREIMARYQELEGATYDASIEPIAPGQTVDVRRDLAVTAFRSPHRIPALGFVVSEKKRKLTARFQGQSQEDIRQATLAGENVSEEIATPLTAFSGDASRGLFEKAPRDFFHARLLLIECSFFDPHDGPRAHQGGHLHIADIAQHADLFENEVIVLTHLSMRANAEEIRREMKRTLPPRLLARTVPFLPEI